MDLSNGTSWPPQPTPPDGGTRAVDVRVVATKGPKGKINVEAKRNGDTFAAKTLDPDHAEQRLLFARKAGVGVEAVIAAIRTVTPTPKPDDATTVVSRPAPFTIAMRGIGQPKGEGRTFEADEPLDALRQALAVTDYPAAEPVLEWADTERLAAVDVDHHDRDLDRRPDPAALEALARVIVPRPGLFWVTHGRGLRLFFTARDGFTAAELAACAAVGVRSREPAAGVEILHHTRHPAYPRPEHPAAGPVREGMATADLGVLARWLSREVEAAAVEEWLAENGYARGGRYEHSRCPLDPQSPSHAEPVQVGEEGIHCFKCEANGLTLAGPKAGWFPWSALVGGGVPARLAAAVRRFCHWEHAQHVVAEDVGLTGELAQLAYQALLKAVHGPQDPRVDAALRAGRGLVRMDGSWATADLSRNHHRDGLTARLAALPAVQALEPDKDGRLVARVVPERLAIFQGVDDLAPYGYSRVLPVRGMKIFHQWHPNPDPAVVRAVVLPEFLRPKGMAPFRPRYVPTGKRMPLSDAEALLSDSFPGIDFDYLRLLIAARGCTEGGRGLPPRVAVDGPSGAGKDATVKIAAALIGDNHRDLPYKPQAERFHLDLYDAGLNAGLVTSQEIIKFASARGEDLLSNLKALMNFETGTSVRVLYVGPQPVRQVPVLVITDTSFPPTVLCDEQLGRRFVYAHLDRKVDWLRSSVEGIERWRALGKEHAAAANALVSDVIDTFFADPTPMLFEDIAHQLGFGALNRGNDMGLDPRADLLELFAACCSPEATPAKDGKWKGRGWKLVRREGTDCLSKAWLRVCDNLGDGFTSSRRAKEVDWAQVLQVDRPVEFDSSPNGGSTLGVRFRQGKPRSPDLKVNEEIRGANRPPRSSATRRAPRGPSPGLAAACSRGCPRPCHVGQGCAARGRCPRRCRNPRGGGAKGGPGGARVYGPGDLLGQ